MEKALLAGDSAGFVNYYVDSAVVIAPGMATMSGRVALGALIGGVLTSTTYSAFALHPLKIVGHNGMLSEIGLQHDVSAASGKPSQESWARYQLTWVRDPEGKWQVAVDALVADSTKALPDSSKP